MSFPKRRMVCFQEAATGPLANVTDAKQNIRDLLIRLSDLVLQREHDIELLLGPRLCRPNLLQLLFNAGNNRFNAWGLSNVHPGGYPLGLLSLEGLNLLF